MHPPSASCRQLFRHHPQLRLAWAGRPPKHADELNPGSFALVQLYHVNDVGTPDDPKTIMEFWNVKPQIEVDTGEVCNVRACRGPLFDRWGGTSIDYDPLVRVPMFVCTLDGGYEYPDSTPLRTEDVYTGKFMFAIEHWSTSLKERKRKSRVKKAREVKSEIDNMSNRFMKDLKDEIKKDPSASSPIIARKHAYEHNKMQSLRGERIKRDLNKAFKVDNEF